MPASEVPVDLTQPVTDILKENVEYEVIINALQSNIQNLVLDNKRLAKIKDRAE
jgi:hypothetical protein